MYNLIGFSHLIPMIKDRLM